jgi:tetratricopeptide (TPR) repeat protein
MKKGYLLKNDLMLLDFIATSDFKRPLYFANPSSVEDFLDIDKYCHLEGTVYKFMPVLAGDYVQGMGGISYDKNCYDLLMNKAQWGNLASPAVTVDRESNRNTTFPKNNFLRLAMRLVEENKKDSAIKVLDRCQEVFPNNKITYDYYMIQFAEVYYRAGAIDKANKMVELLAKIYEENITYYSSLKPEFAKYYDKDKNQAVAVIQRLGQIADEYKQNQISKKIGSFFATNPGLLGN